ncbi:hypothetical protein [Spirosoma agri]|uniref:Uncharacterized protein n=1 Tax=Spirosoma agri TaxID=1987381 RepID=A0A6M0IBG6_9BACT|nr:hypothetical protein [Spirosoma agri]NEU65338.1 hypothetical protein [Spirosoma agri]
MEEVSSASDPSPDKYNLEEILENWFNAIIAVRTNHSRIHAYIVGAAQSEPNNEGTLYIGQCPVSELESLLVAMQGEIEKLRKDMEPSDEGNQNKPKRSYAKLINHTSILNRLNDQAKVRLNLASRPAS